jgi:hypothetical protein
MTTATLTRRPASRQIGEPADLAAYVQEQSDRYAALGPVQLPGESDSEHVNRMLDDLNCHMASILHSLSYAIRLYGCHSVADWWYATHEYDPTPISVLYRLSSPSVLDDRTDLARQVDTEVSWFLSLGHDAGKACAWVLRQRADEFDDDGSATVAEYYAEPSKRVSRAKQAVKVQRASCLGCAFDDLTRMGFAHKVAYAHKVAGLPIKSGYSAR